MEKQSMVEVVAGTILTGIRTGSFKVGEVLPPQRELSRLFDASMLVVREAIKLLEGKGILASRRGSGTFVLTDKIPAASVEGLDYKKYRLRDIMDFTSFIWNRSPNVVCVEASDADLRNLYERSKKMLGDYLEKKASPHSLFIYESTYSVKMVQISGNTLAYNLVRELFKVMSEIDYVVTQSPKYRSILEIDTRIGEALMERNSYQAMLWSMERDATYGQIVPHHLFEKECLVSIQQRVIL